MMIQHTTTTTPPITPNPFLSQDSSKKREKNCGMTLIPTADAQSAVNGVQKTVFSMTPITPPEKLTGCLISHERYPMTPNPALRTSYSLSGNSSSFRDLLNPSLATSQQASSSRKFFLEQAEKVYQLSLEKCKEEGDCNDLQRFGHLVSKHPPLKELYGKKLFSPPKDPNCSVWESSRPYHGTNKDALLNILKTGTLEARQDPVSASLIRFKTGVYLGTDERYLDNVKFKIVFEPTVLLGQAPYSTDYSESRGTMRTNSITASSETVAFITVAKVKPEELERITLEIQTAAGWKVPVYRQEEVEDKIVNESCPISIPTHLNLKEDSEHSSIPPYVVRHSELW